MLSTDLWRWYINVTTTILDIIHRSVFYLKHSGERGWLYLLDPTEWIPPEDGDGIQSPKHRALNRREDDE
jgi:hypothetical protein